MQRISTATRVIDKFGPGRDGFANGNPATGAPSTQLEAEWYDSQQEEMANVIELAGMTLNPADMTQLWQAINSRIAAATGNFVLRTGDTMSGNLTVPALFANSAVYPSFIAAPNCVISSSAGNVDFQYQPNWLWRFDQGTGQLVWFGDGGAGAAPFLIISPTGDANVRGTFTAVNIGASGTVSGVNVVATNNVSADSVTAANVSASGNIAASGTVSGFNVFASNNVLSDSINANQIASTGSIVASGTVQGATVFSTGAVAALGNNLFGLHQGPIGPALQFSSSYAWEWNGATGDLIWGNASGMMLDIRPPGSPSQGGGNAYNHQGDWLPGSDSRLKREIAPSDYGLDEILQLRPVSYYRDQPDEAPGPTGQTPPAPHRYVGFIAQDVLQVLPEAVLAMDTSDDPLLALDKTPILAAAVNAIKELATRMTALEGGGIPLPA
jgi:hypothetical protein